MDDEYEHHGNTVLTGDEGTGKTTMLHEVLWRLIFEYHPSHLNILFGSGRDGDLAEKLTGLPHVVGAHNGLLDDPEPFIKSFRRDQARRSRLRRSCRGERLPALLVVIDDFESMGQMDPRLRRMLNRISSWRDTRYLLMALREVDPHSHQASICSPYRMHLGGEDALSEFPEGLQSIAQRGGTRQPLWCLRRSHGMSLNLVRALPDESVAVEALCGAVGFPVVKDSHLRVTRPALAQKIRFHHPHVHDVQTESLFVRSAFTSSATPEPTLNSIDFLPETEHGVEVHATWVCGSWGSTYPYREGNPEELAVRVTVRGAELDLQRLEAAIASMDHSMRYPDRERYFALWSELSSQLREAHALTAHAR